MSYRGIVRGLGIATVMAAIIGVAWWLIAYQPKAIEKTGHKPPASITLNEAKLNEITLTSEAVGRLAISTAEIEWRPVTLTRSFGGEIVVPPGQSIIVSAPVNGLLKAPSQGEVKPGQAVRIHAPVFDLIPLLTPEGRAGLTTSLVDAVGQVKAATAQREAGQIAYERAKRVFDNEAGSRRAVDEAQAQLRVGEEVLAAAIARQRLLEKLLDDASSGTAAPLAIESPRDGIIRSLSALPGQQVPAGSPLFEVVDLSEVWVRVPVFVGDYEQLDEEAEAIVTALTSKPGMTGVAAKRTEAPPTADPMAATVDAYFSIENVGGRYRPGERVAVQLLLDRKRESLVVPWAAVVYDVYGGTWIYERTGELTFVRRRVIVREVYREQAILDNGPPAGTKVVVAGTAELFGTETGFTK
ncbi:MAG: HlyD family efflux transporter periplasmic adaptor subunit [Pirellulales bacterium]